MKILALALLAVTGVSHAQYKCTADGGAVTYQQAACPVTTVQRVLRAGTTLPTRVVPTSATDPRTAAAKPAGAPPAEDNGVALSKIEIRFKRLKAINDELDLTRRIVSR